MNNTIKAYFFALFILILILNIYMFVPLFDSIAFGAILAGAYYPLFKMLKEKYRLSHNLAAGLTTSAVIISIIIPIIYMAIQISREAVNVYGELQGGLNQEMIRNFLFGNGPIGNALGKALSLFNIDMTNDDVYDLVLKKMQGLTGFVLSTINSWLSNTFSFLFKFIVMILTVHGFIISGEDLKNYLFELSPLPDDQENHILQKFNQMNFATLVGNGLGGILQGVLAGVGLWFLGANSIFLWTTLMIFLAFIPLVGISFVTIPAAIIAFLSGAKIAAVVYIIYASIVAVVVENYVKPRFIGSRVKIDSLLLLFYIIAGMTSFGFLGIFYGPLLATFFVSLAEIFKKSYSGKDET
jgi:predicted PurR-regulated permease PerM